MAVKKHNFKIGEGLVNKEFKISTYSKLLITIALGAAGNDIAIEAAHIALMREDWRLVPEVLRVARRTMGVVKMNLVFTAVYNLVGLALAALGILPPVLAAAAQSLPDLGILTNSARLLQARTSEPMSN